MIRNLFFFKRLNYLGGTEQFLYEICKKYSKDFNIVVVYEEGSINQVKRLTNYVDVVKWKKGQKIECERAFLNFNIDIIDDLICDDIYFVSHANFEEIGYKPPTHPRLKRCIAVSNFTKDIYERHYDTPTELCYNPISIEKFEKPLILMSAFRGSDPVKGAKRIQKLVERLDLYCVNHNKRYLYLVFSDKLCVEINSPNVVVLEPRVDVRAYMPMADWGITLSNDMETYCYTNVEFLMQGIPIVTTPLTVCEELKMDSSMRLILDWNMSNVDEIVEQMFANDMKFNYTPPNDRWNEILVKGEGGVEESMKVKLFEVIANDVSSKRGIHLSELGRPALPGEVFQTTEDRLDNLVNGKNKFGVAFAEIKGEMVPEEEMEKPSKAIKEEPKEIPVERPIIEEVKPKRGRKPKK